MKNKEDAVLLGAPDNLVMQKMQVELHELHLGSTSYSPHTALSFFSNSELFVSLNAENKI